MQFDFNPFSGTLDIVDKPLRYRYWIDADGIVWRESITTAGNLYTEVLSGVSNGFLLENGTDLQILENGDYITQEA